MEGVQPARAASHRIITLQVVLYSIFFILVRKEKK